jgi:uncharacterized protein YndB with AHSA1/START domain
MATPASETSLHFTHRFQASRQRVYRAWTEPEILMRWFVESEGRVDKCNIDLRPGGNYRIEGRMGDKPWSIYGKYLEVKPSEKLVYTWQWDFDPTMGVPDAPDGLPVPSADTLVTVEFRDLGKETELTLTHERFTSDAAREGHKKGWIGCFERLEKYV